MKYDHTGLIVSLKDMDLPLFESEALMHSLQYYKTERYFLNKRNEIKFLTIHDRYLVDDFPNNKTDLTDIELQNFLN